MDAKKLRIGNLVYIGNDIIELNQKNFESLIVFKTYDRINPIPLTEEWMRKAGFETLDCEVDLIVWGGTINDPNGESFSIISDGLDKPYPLYFAYDLGYGEKRKEIKYIHQLQNLYYDLTGEELEFKL